MKVSELIEVLRKYPQDLDVAYECYSEFCLLEQKNIGVMKACFPRPDGWIECARPDKPQKEYLMFPGN